MPECNRALKYAFSGAYGHTESDGTFLCWKECKAWEGTLENPVNPKKKKKKKKGKGTEKKKRNKEKKNKRKVKRVNI